MKKVMVLIMAIFLVPILSVVGKTIYDGITDNYTFASMNSTSTYYIPGTMTFYPDADAETTSIDGFVGNSWGGGEPWADLRSQVGTDANSIAQSIRTTAQVGGGGAGQWTTLERIIILFDTSTLPDTAIITSATLSTWGNAKTDSASASPDICVYSSNPASNTDLIAADYSSLGATAFSNTITYAGWNLAGWNDFIFNASGLTAISKTGVSKFGLRNANYDAAGVSPPWVAFGAFSFSMDSADFIHPPKLVVNYNTLTVVINPSITSVNPWLVPYARAWWWLVPAGVTVWLIIWFMKKEEPKPPTFTMPTQPRQPKQKNQPPPPMFIKR